MSIHNPQIGDVVRLIRKPTLGEYSSWQDNWGMAGQIGEVTEPGNPGCVWVAFNGDTWEWPIACLEIVARKGIGTNWTTDRPTEPGEYWVSIDPGKRKGRIDFPGVIPCQVSLCANSYLLDIGSLNIGSDMNGTTLAARYITGGQWVPLSNEWYDGAKWSRRETPADPFQEG